MCTSTASKPARSNAAAISTWPFTPCSRRIATRGRAPVAMNGAATSSAGSKVSVGDEPGSSASSRVVFLVRGAAGLSRRRCIACVVADHARCRSRRDSSSTHRRAAANRHAIRRRIGVADDRSRARPASRACDSTDCRRRRRGPAPPRRAPRRTARRARRPPCQSSDDRRGRSATRTPSRPASTNSAAVADDRDRRAGVRRVAAAGPREERARAARSSRSGASSPSWPYTCASAEPPRRLPAAAEIDDAAATCRRVEPQQRRQRTRAHRRPARTPRRSATRGAVTRLVAVAVAPGRAHRQRILADRDRRCRAPGRTRARPRAPCRTARRPRRDGRRRPSSSPTASRRRACAIAGRGDVGDRLADRHAARRRRVDQRERRALAHRHRLAGVAVEIARASPRQSATGTCHGPTIGSRAHRPPTVRSPIVIEERLVGDRREAQHALRAPRRSVDAAEVERRQRARDARHVAHHLRRLAEDHVERHVDRRSRRTCDRRRRSRPSAGRACRRRRTGSARARRSRESARDRSARSPARSAPAPRCTRSRAATCRAPRDGIARSSMRAAAPPPCTSSGSAFDRPPAPTSWIDRIGLRRAELPAAVDHFLRAALHLGVAALHRVEVEVGGVGAGRHRRRRAAAHADQHARARRAGRAACRRRAAACARARARCCRGRRRS